MLIFVLFVSSGTLFDGAFSLRVSLIMDPEIYKHLQPMDQAYEHYERFRTQLMLIFAIIILCSRLRLSICYFFSFF